MTLYPPFLVFPETLCELNHMSAVIIVPNLDDTLKNHIQNHFDDYILLELKPNKDKFYEEAKKAIDVAKTVRNVFFIANGPVAFNAVLAAKLAFDLNRPFFVAEWIGNRFKILKVP